MVNVEVSLAIGAGIASGAAGGDACCASRDTAVPAATVVSAAALDPAALRKFRREYCTAGPPCAWNKTRNGAYAGTTQNGCLPPDQVDHGAAGLTKGRARSPIHRVSSAQAWASPWR